VIIPDVNLLVYAHVSGLAEHAKAKLWWEGLMNAPAPVGLAAPALYGFIRVATHPRILDHPMTVETAVSQVKGWLSRRQVTFLAPGPRHLEIAFRLLREVGAAGNLTTDAQLAALAIEHQAELHSNDADFARFPQLRWVNPLR
jgi:toxin-antitoxin system PIN domain toxin